MNIVIAGAGEYGHYVARRLSTEEHNVLIIDPSSDALEDIDANYDVMTQQGSTTSIKDLQSCNMRDCDLFVAVTPRETENITAAILASNLGAKKTIARISSYEYLLPKNKEVFTRLGIHRLIYPETLAAAEIVQAVKRGWIREYRTFTGEALVLVCVKVRQNSELINKQFRSGFFNHDKFRVVALRRHNHSIIPGGNDEILANDLVYFICTKDNLENVRIAAGKKNFEINNIIIMGGSTTALKTVQFLPDDINVKIIDSDKARCYALAEETDTLIIHGDGRNTDLLRDEGIADADAFIALTSSAETNILTCLTAKHFGVRKTIAAIENLDYFNMADNLDIGTIINTKIITASNIYQQILDATAYDVQCLTYSNAIIAEFLVKEGNKITKAKVRELDLPANVNIGGIIRNGQGFVVNGDTLIKPGDHAVVFCKSSSIRRLAKFFE